MPRDYRTLLAVLAATTLTATALAQPAKAPTTGSDKAKQPVKVPETKPTSESPPKETGEAAEAKEQEASKEQEAKDKAGAAKDEARAKGRERAEQAKEHAAEAKAAGLAKATEARGGEAPPAYQKLSDKQKAKVRQEKFDLDKNHLAIKGYDPVTYFPEGGEKPAKGDKKFEWENDGVKYRFVSEKNRELFKANPEKFAPAYGGWCAYAMAKGDYTEPDPKRYLIQNGKLMLFYDGFFGDTYKKWNDEGPKELEPKADEFWKGEIVKESEKVAAEKDG